MTRNAPRTAFLAAALMLTLGACERQPSLPLRPTGPTSGGVRIEIEGPTEIAPGHSVSFRAMSISPAGAREDVTHQAAWEVSAPSVLNVAGPGRVNALDRGESDIMVRFEQTGASARVMVLEPGTYRVAGLVRDRFSIPGARVTVTSGTGSGLTTLTNAGGGFLLYGVAGAVELTASREGYQTTVRSVTVTSHMTADVAMRPVLDPLRLEGNWTLGIRSSSGCSGMPAEAERREYPVSIVQSGAALNITLQAKFYYGSTVTLTGRVLNDTVTFSLPADPVDGAWVTEQLPSGNWLAISGTAQGRPAPNGLAGQLSGGFEYYGAPGSRTSCTRDDHTFDLLRSGA